MILPPGRENLSNPTTQPLQCKKEPLAVSETNSFISLLQFVAGATAYCHSPPQGPRLLYFFSLLLFVIKHIEYSFLTLFKDLKCMK
jgi:hypothetical protein